LKEVNDPARRVTNLKCSKAVGGEGREKPAAPLGRRPYKTWKHSREKREEGIGGQNKHRNNLSYRFEKVHNQSRLKQGKLEKKEVFHVLGVYATAECIRYWGKTTCDRPFQGGRLKHYFFKEGEREK